MSPVVAAAAVGSPEVGLAGRAGLSGRCRGSGGGPRGRRVVPGERGVEVRERADLDVHVVAARHRGMEPARAAHPHRAPPQAAGRDEVLGRVVGHVRAPVARQAELALEVLEGGGVGLALPGAERLGEHDQIRPLRQHERLGLGLLAGEGAVGHDREGDVGSQAVEPRPGVGQHLDGGGVGPVHLDQAGHEPVGRFHAGAGEGVVEDGPPHAGLERRPRAVAQVVDAQLVAGPGADRVEPAPDVVPLQVQRVVDVEHDQAPPGDVGAAGGVDGGAAPVGARGGGARRGHAGASDSSTNTAAS